MNIEDRIEQLRRMDAAYYADNAIVSDAAYDAFRDETRRLAPDHPYFKAVGAPAVSEWEKVRLGYPMRSLHKVQTPDEARDWIEKVGAPEICEVEKLDGISLLLRYEDGVLVRAATRGDGEVGEDITVNARKMGGVQVKLDGRFTGHVRGEVVVKKSVFEAHLKANGYKNCRNAAGGAAKYLGGTRCHLLTVMSYEFVPDSGPLESKAHEMLALVAKGFITPRWTRHKDAGSVLARYADYVESKRESLDYDIDGLVLYINATDAREALGGEDRPEGARAFKFPHERAETTLRDIIWQVGGSGRITPVAVFDAVDLAGATVRQASLHNVANIVRLAKEVSDRLRLTDARSSLGRGDRIVVSRRNDVIPYVESVETPNLADFDNCSWPFRCPTCDTATTMQGEYLVCPNKTGCDAQTVGGIKRWLKKLDVKEFGDALVEAVCAAGLVSEPADLYRLTVEQVADLRLSEKKVGKATATKALKNLEAKKCLPLHVLVGSLGIPLWSRSMTRLLVKAGYDSLGKMGDAAVSDLVKIAGVEMTKAQAFVDGFAEVSPKIASLLVVGITVAPEATGSMRGSSVCMTGFRDSAMEAAVEAQGGEVKSSVGKGLTYLVAKDPNGTSGKLTAARANGTKVVGVEEMWALLGGRPS